MRIGMAAMVAASALLLTACSAISSGTITEKTYHEAYSYITMQCTAYNTNGTCMVTVPITQYVDESFSFSIIDGKDTGWVYVTETEYHAYEVGDWYGEEN